MEPTYDTTTLDPTTLQALLGDSNTSLIPESLVTTLIVSFVLLNVLGLLFFIFYVLGIIRKWKVQSAVFHMQKDIAEIKTALVKPAVVEPPVERPVEPPVKPAESNAVIAEEESGDATS